MKQYWELFRQGADFPSYSRALLMIESTQVPRMGVTEENTPHCQWNAGFTPDLEACPDRFMLNKPDGRSTDILHSKFMDIDRAKWIPWKAPLLK